LNTPVAVPLAEAGLAALITGYGNIAAPDAMPVRRPRIYGGRIPTRPYKVVAMQASSTDAGRSVWR